ncbi:hypothetical protein Lalb_Chr15g0090011 [Lupinus albus]|uniref:Late nodulin n=1 Tax=Lupinus albus TaxID=3870 RepID=A0A6A4PE92_LUPAL|nr:hypothetical protein Lalb_Chr15g0090011 [Lupinus albus]
MARAFEIVYALLILFCLFFVLTYASKCNIDIDCYSECLYMECRDYTCHNSKCTCINCP